MRRWIDSSRISSFSLLLLLTAQVRTASALTTPFSSSDLLTRADPVCGGKEGLSQCGTGFPSEFCCPTESTCILLNSTIAKSAICCPKGEDCKFLKPLTCDIREYNAILHPGNRVHIANTTEVKLQKCGDECCPLGYSCNGGTCVADEAEKVTPSPSASSTPLPSSTTSPSASQTTVITPIPAVQPQSEFPAKAVVAGFFPGMFFGAILTLLFLWVIKKRRESQEKNRYSGDFGHVSRNVSDPIYDPAYGARTDFLRRGSQSVRNSPTSTTGMVQRESRAPGWSMTTPRIQGLFFKSPKIGTSAVATPAQAFHAVDRDPYRTPTRSPARRSSKGKGKQRPDTASTETIDVLMPPPSFLQVPFPGNRENRFTQDTQATTFTKLMKEAGYEEDRREEVRGWKGSPAAR